MARNLVESLGRDYVNQMCVGAIFQVEPKSVHVLRGAGADHLTTKKIVLDSKAPWRDATLPLDALKSFADLAYPKLNYRQVESPYGLIVTDVSMRRSASRGLRTENLRAQNLPVYSRILRREPEGWHALNVVGQIRMIYSPQWTPFSVGIKMLLEGDTLAFAVSEDIAVVSSCSGDKDKMADILFRGKKAGDIGEDGTVYLFNKILKRASVRNKLRL